MVFGVCVFISLYVSLWHSLQCGNFWNLLFEDPLLSSLRAVGTKLSPRQQSSSYSATEALWPTFLGNASCLLQFLFLSPVPLAVDF